MAKKKGKASGGRPAEKTENTQPVKKRKRSMREEDRGAICLILAVLLYVFSRAQVVAKTGVESSAYIFSAYQVLLFFLMVFPLPLSETLVDMIPERIAQRHFRNAKHLFNAGVVQSILYSIIVISCWVAFSERISLKYLLGRYNSFSLLLLIGVFVFDLAMLLLRGYLDALHEKTFGFVWMMRQVVGFVMVLVFSDVFKKAGGQVSLLLKNNEVGYAYSAAGVALGLVFTALCGFLLYLFVYIKSRGLILQGIRSDTYKYGENSLSRLLSGAVPLALTGGCIAAAALLLMGRYFSLMHEAGSMSLISYQWGIYTGICRTALCFPLFIALLIMMDSFRELRVAVRANAYPEVRFRLQGLLRLGMMLATLFAAFFFSGAPVIVKGFFGTESMLAVRLLRIMALLVFPAVYALMSSLAIYAEKRTLRVALHIVFALGISMLLWRVCLPLFSITIYGVLFAEGIFTLILSIANFIHLSFSVGLFLSRADEWIGIVIGGVVSVGIGFLFTFLCGLFLPAWIAAVLTFFLCFLTAFWCDCFFGSMQSNILKSIPLGHFLRRLGRMMRAL